MPGGDGDGDDQRGVGHSICTFGERPPVSIAVDRGMSEKGDVPPTGPQHLERVAGRDAADTTAVRFPSSLLLFNASWAPTPASEECWTRDWLNPRRNDRSLAIIRD